MLKKNVSSSLDIFIYFCTTTQNNGVYYGKVIMCLESCLCWIAEGRNTSQAVILLFFCDLLFTGILI